jgi:UDP-N-acetylmuramoylalanine--D-glutamate ligase
MIVAEVAGFMLETCTSFRPDVSACLNITEDHLDRYGTMDVYASMKTRVYRWQGAQDAAIGNANCALTMAGLRAARARQYTFDSLRPSARGADLGDPRDVSELRLVLDGGVERYPAADLRLIGVHNLENAMAAYLAARLVGVPPGAIRAGARAFRPQKHRMELVGERDGIHYYDDSKGTNVAAVAASLRGFPCPVILIAGGVDKGGSYQPMFDALAGVARGMILIGRARPIIRAAADAAQVTYPVLDAATMEEAVQKATGLARSGDAVVLSPACSSYDMFRHFGDRGMAFREALGAVGARSVDYNDIDPAGGARA